MDEWHPRRLIELEAARGFAALYVVVYHAGILHGSRLKVLVSFGQEAVILFFLVSGFVIYYSTFSRSRRPSLPAYLNRRARRIWPLFVITLLFSYLVMAVQQHSVHAPHWGTLAGNLIMLQDNSSLKPGVWFDTFGDSALWSLSYEWWFYMLFIPVAVGLLAFPRMQTWTAFALSAAGCLVYEIAPNEACLILGYFFMWWCGVECAREYLQQGRVTVKGQLKTLVLLGALTCLWSIPAVMSLSQGDHLRWGVFPVLSARHLLSAMVLMSAGLAWAQFGRAGFRVALRPLAALAPISYALYLIHLPVLGLIRLLLPVAPEVRLIVALLVLLPLCYLLELKAQPRIERLLDRIWAGLRTSTATIASDPAYASDIA